jgi:hypothetical protein
MYRAACRNRGGVESLLVNRCVQTGTAASGVRWYELRIDSTNPAVFQQGTFSPADGVSRWLGSMAMDQCGNIALGYSVSSAAVYPGIRYTGRVPADAAGQMQKTSGTFNWNTRVASFKLGSCQ